MNDKIIASELLKIAKMLSAYKMPLGEVVRKFEDFLYMTSPERVKVEFYDVNIEWDNCSNDPDRDDMCRTGATYEMDIVTKQITFIWQDFLKKNNLEDSPELRDYIENNVKKTLIALDDADFQRKGDITEMEAFIKIDVDKGVAHIIELDIKKGDDSIEQYLIERDERESKEY